MNKGHTGYRAYLQNQIQTAPPDKLVVMLYDGALRFIAGAVQAMEVQQKSEAHNRLVRAQAIIAELMTTLNMEAGEIAGNLLLLYEYLYRRLIEANISKEPEAAQEVMGLLVSLREAWIQASVLIREGTGS